jgi:hypothetical protein
VSTTDTAEKCADAQKIPNAKTDINAIPLIKSVNLKITAQMPHAKPCRMILTRAMFASMATAIRKNAAVTAIPTANPDIAATPR